MAATETALTAETAEIAATATPVEAAEQDLSGEQSGQLSRPRSSDFLWFPLTAIVTAALAVLPLLFNNRFYFLADTALGAYGQWYYLGQELRAGHWPGLELSRWGSGNFLADGQWGLFSALTMSISLLATLFNNILIFVSSIKIGFLVLGSMGLYLLARSFKVSPGMAAVLGIAAALGGFTIHIDATSWVTNLEIWALVPWTWWGIRRIVAGKSPWIALLFGYFTVTTGYVHGTLMLVVVFIGVLITCLLEKQGRAFWRVLFTGIAVGLMAIVVYLPGVLSSSVTVRDNVGVENTGAMTASLSDLLGSISPTAQMGVQWWWGNISPNPIVYIAWFLPLFVLVDFRAAKKTYRELFVAFLILLVTFLFVTGPSEVGPLRFPTRLLPFLGTSLLIIFVVLFDRHRVTKVSRTRWGFGVLITAVCALQVLGANPQNWRLQAYTLLGVVAGLFVAMLVAQAYSKAGHHNGSRRYASATVALAAVLIVGCMAATVQQRIHFNGFESNPTPELPTKVSAYRAQLPDAKNNGVVVGDTSAANYGPEMYGMAAASNLWYLNPHVDMLNTYYVAAYRTLADRICEQNQGQTCGDLLRRLREPDAKLGVSLADLMSLDSILIVKSAVPQKDYDSPMPGWSVASQDSQTILWTRDVPRGKAGGVVWATKGLQYNTSKVNDTVTNLKIGSVPAGGADIVFSRLPWPGYSVSGAASLSAPHDGFLVTVHVPEAAKNSTISLTWKPPMYKLMLAAGVGSIILSLALICFAAWGQRRRIRRAAAESPIATSPLASAVAEAEAVAEARQGTRNNTYRSDDAATTITTIDGAGLLTAAEAAAAALASRVSAVTDKRHISTSGNDTAAAHAYEPLTAELEGLQGVAVQAPTAEKASNGMGDHASTQDNAGSSDEASTQVSETPILDTLARERALGVNDLPRDSSSNHQIETEDARQNKQPANDLRDKGSKPTDDK